MIRPDFGKWSQDAEAIRRLGVEAAHKRSRERYQALYMISIGQTNASQWAEKIGRNPRTIMEWVHTYNAKGPTAIHYEHSGGRTPLLAQKRSKRSLKRSSTVSQRNTVCRVMAGR